MALDGKILRRALDRCEEDRRRRETAVRLLREEIYGKDPRVAELDGLLRSSVAEAAAAALQKGTDPVATVAAIQEKNLAAQEERAARIDRLGYPRAASTTNRPAPSAMTGAISARSPASA